MINASRLEIAETHGHSLTISKEMFFATAKNVLLTCIILGKKKLSAFDDSRTKATLTQLEGVT